MHTSNSSTLPIITLDTCVLMHSFTRKLLLQLAKYPLFFPIWSEEIGKEWRRNAPRIWHVEPQVVKQEWDQMQQAFPLANMGEVAPFYKEMNERFFPYLAPSTQQKKEVLYYCLQPEVTQPLQSYLFKRIDKKDRHIALCALVAAQRLNSTHNILLTWNTNDFHRRELKEHQIALKTPDQYLSDLCITHREQLIHSCQLLYQEHLTLSQHAYTLTTLLKRDKLYRLANLLQGERKQ